MQLLCFISAIAYSGSKYEILKSEVKTGLTAVLCKENEFNYPNVGTLTQHHTIPDGVKLIYNVQFIMRNVFGVFLYENISFAFKRVVTCSASKNK